MNTRIEKQGREAAEALGEAGEHAKAATAEMGEKARQMGQRFGEAWESTRARVQEKTMASARATDKAIRDFPYASLGIAFGVGLLLGVLLNRGRD